MRTVAEQDKFGHRMMRGADSPSLMLWIMVMIALPGCWRPEMPSDAQLDRGCVYLLPGVESGAWQWRDAVAGLREGGVDQAVRVVEWGDRPFGSLSNLVSYAKNRERARAIAADISAYASAHPQHPVTLIGYSGGGGLAVLTAEALPEGTRLDRLILIAAALSPQYDLSTARLACRDPIINFRSERDRLTLGVGTSLFGTIDRSFCASAGKSGFEGTGEDKVVQIAWRLEWRKLGHGGGHVGWLSGAWAREVLAPQIPRARRGSACSEAMALRY